MREVSRGKQKCNFPQLSTCLVILLAIQTNIPVVGLSILAFVVVLVNPLSFALACLKELPSTRLALYLLLPFYKDCMASGRLSMYNLHHVTCWF